MNRAPTEAKILQGGFLPPVFASAPGAGDTEGGARPSVSRNGYFCFLTSTFASFS